MTEEKSGKDKKENRPQNQSDANEQRDATMQQMRGDAARFGVEFDVDKKSAQQHIQSDAQKTRGSEDRTSPKQPSDLNNKEARAQKSGEYSTSSQDTVDNPPSQQREIDLDNPNAPLTSKESTGQSAVNKGTPLSQFQAKKESDESSASTYDPNAATRVSERSTQTAHNTASPGAQRKDPRPPQNDPARPKPQEDSRKQNTYPDTGNITLGDQEDKNKTHLRDPLFASRVLEQEKQPLRKERESSGKEAGSADSAPAVIQENEGVQTPAGKQRSIPIVRTYKGDVARALKKDNTSQVQMVLAEEQKRQKQKEAKNPRSKQNKPLLIGSIIFGAIGLLALAGGGYFFWIGQQERGSGKEQTVETNPLIFTEEERGIDITDKSPSAIQDAVRTELNELDIRLDFVAYVYFTKNIPASDQPTVEEQETVKTLIAAPQFFAGLESRMPGSLSRALADNFMYGIHSFNGNQPFIILKADFFENAFAGMLNWEPFMARELLPLFDIPVTDEVRNKPFTDVVIKNRDLRALLDEEGNIVLLYTFFDRETIIITAAEETLEEVITRLQRPKAQQ